MDPKMTAERFAALADAYGAEPRRWPVAERAAAEAFLRDQGVAAERILFSARMLDAALDASPAPSPSADLHDRVAALAARAGLRPRPRRPLVKSPLAWASGVGWAAACAAGLLAGVNVTSQLAADAAMDAVLYQAALSGPDDTEVLG